MLARYVKGGGHFKSAIVVLLRLLLLDIRYANWLGRQSIGLDSFLSVLSLFSSVQPPLWPSLFPAFKFYLSYLSTFL